MWPWDWWGWPWEWFNRRRRHPHLISILVPYRPDRSSVYRARNWRWLKQHWECALPNAEIVVGRNYDYPFSKTRAINNAASRARGDIFVILDADAYIDAEVIKECAARIRQARRRGYPLWFIPYRHIYRLTKSASARLTNSDPCDPLFIPSPPPKGWIHSTEGSMHGHRYGALVQIMPREAFELVGGMDHRFVGWGGEDVAFVRALDTLYGPHKTTDNDVLHVWHPQLGVNHKTRRWEGQSSLRVNEHLAQRYNRATGDRMKMWNLVAEGRRRGRLQRFLGG